MTSQRGPSHASGTQSADDDLAVVLDACRALVAISVKSVESVADEVDLVELRILVVLATRGTSSLRDLADATHLHLSRASRACDRLVARALLIRGDDPEDRRVLRLELTGAGKDVVHRVTKARREAIAPILATMSVPRRSELVRSLRAFAAASGESTNGDLSLLAWTS